MLFSEQAAKVQQMMTSSPLLSGSTPPPPKGKQPIATAPSTPIDESKRYCEDDHHDHGSDCDGEPIRPSIPTIIPLRGHGSSSGRLQSRHHHRGDGDDGIGNNSSNNEEDCQQQIEEDDQNSVSSKSSLISEVTLMTFSEEKAAMLKSEFLSRVQQSSHTRPLSTDEKMELLREIQADQDRKFKVEIQRQEIRANNMRREERSREEFFERLNSLRVGGDHHRRGGGAGEGIASSGGCSDGHNNVKGEGGGDHSSGDKRQLRRKDTTNSTTTVQATGRGERDLQGSNRSGNSSSSSEEKKKGINRRASLTMPRRGSGLLRRRSVLTQSGE
jgi:hypothetical protein